MRYAFLLPALMLGACDGGVREPAAANEAAPAAPMAKAGAIDRSHSGEAVPDAAFQGPDGESASLADFAGKPLLVNLWATWCAPCIAEMPTLDALAAREGDKLQVLALSQDGDERAKVDAFFAERNFKFLEPYLDRDLAIMDALKIQTLPTTILYDAKGREVWRVSGPMEWDGPEAARLIGEAGA